MKSGGGIQSFFSFMAKHHHFVEDMFRFGLKTEWIITESDIFNLIPSKIDEPDLNKKSIIDKLVTFGVISEFMGDSYEVQPQFRNFLQWLLKERKLYDHGYLVSSIEKMQRAQNSVEMNHTPSPEKRQHAKIAIRYDLKQVIEAMDDLSLFVKTNRDSIVLATKSVADDEKYESKLARYLEVKRLYDEYVEPSKKMVEEPFANTCDSVIRTLDETELIYIEDEYILNLSNIIKTKMILLRKLIAGAHHDMWNDLTIALKELSTFVELHRGALLGQKLILQKGAKGLNTLIEEHLHIISFNPRNLFTNIGLESYLSDLAAAEYKIPEFNVPASIVNPHQPIQIQQLETDLFEQKRIDDLLEYVISENQDKSLEQCFIATIELTEKFRQNILLTDGKKRYQFHGTKLNFNGLVWEAELS
jgi:hypothetical protein